MKLTELEAAQLESLQLQRQIALLNTQAVEARVAAWAEKLAARTGLSGPLNIAPDGTVTGTEVPE